MIIPPLIIKLLQNTAILFSVILLYNYLWVNNEAIKRWYNKLLAGLFVAAVGLLLMLTPWTTAPGVFFDTRSILLAISGLFIGPVPTIIATAVLTIYRLTVGGPGQWMGIAVVLLSGGTGILWGLSTRLRLKRITWKQLLLFGLNVHVLMLVTTLLLPSPYFESNVRALLFPFLVIYPLVTMLMGLVMLRRSDNWSYRKQLIESKALYSSLVDHMPAGVFRKTKDGRYDYVNQRFCELKGLIEAEILGKNPEELAAYESKKSATGGYLNPPVQFTLVKQGSDHHEWIVRHGMPILMEEAYPQSDGKINYFQVIKTPILGADGQVVGSQGMQLDITAHKRAEEALLAEQYLLNAFMDTIPDVIYFKDAESRIIRFNRAYALLLGVTDERGLLGKTDFDFFTTEHAKQAFDDEQAIMRTGQPLINIEEKETWQDGRTTWSMTSKIPLRNKEGLITGTFGVSRDITKRKQLEFDLMAAKLKAEESDRLKTAFLHNISHEIRTPMNAIMGFSGFLTDPEIDAEQKQHFTDVILQSSHQLMSIIDDIVRIATIEAGQETLQENELSLNGLLVFLMEQFAPKAAVKRLNVEMMPGLEDNNTLILADETKLTQVLSNLLENALKFTREGQVQIGYVLKRGYLEFFVKDTGIGIPEAKHRSIFDRFNQVESSVSGQFGGSGLGLSICQAYVHLHGGEIWVESELGQGAAFFFTLPYRPVVHSQPMQPALGLRLKAGQGGGSTFLVAEDEDLNFMLVRELLRKHPVKIIRAVNGAEAVEIARTTTLDLVLMDLKMPVMDGFEATRIIKTFQPDLPIVALTAYSLEVDKNKALQCGCAEVLVKPINPAYFYERLNSYLEKSIN